jgi:hypothetical protein
VTRVGGSVLTVLQQRHAEHRFHDEVGPPRRRRAGIEYPCNVGMLHQREDLPLRPEARDHAARIHAELDHLEGHGAAHRLELFGQPHHPEAARAEEPGVADNGRSCRPHDGRGCPLRPTQREPPRPVRCLRAARCSGAPRPVHVAPVRARRPPRGRPHALLDRARGRLRRARVLARVGDPPPCCLPFPRGRRSARSGRAPAHETSTGPRTGDEDGGARGVRARDSP